MKIGTLVLLSALAVLALGVISANSANPPAPAKYHSAFDLAFNASGKMLAVTDHTSAAVAIIDPAAGDLGGPAARKYDCEAWVPTQSRYRELTSTSNCTTFQARRLGVRERTADGSLRAVATLNGTLCAMPRIIVAILENHQQPDGSVRIPAALQPFLGGRTELTPPS